MLLPLLTELRNKTNISFCSDEAAAFHLHGSVNRHNVRCWSEENPLVTIEIVIQSAKVHVCCSMSESHVIGPYFLMMMIP